GGQSVGKRRFYREAQIKEDFVRGRAAESETGSGFGRRPFQGCFFERERPDEGYRSEIRRGDEAKGRAGDADQADRSGLETKMGPERGNPSSGPIFLTASAPASAFDREARLCVTT